ncbi:MAG: phosphoglucosamine mutase [Candidatus Actinomarina sp.]|nr:phosphoglucosamine mutase [Candidatus Actinomarina sp.]MBL6835642.1 phosphoglucosamine mutase [Candidatus Actinomarina sp.]
MKKYFGTDGIRGIPNKNLTKEIVANVACSVEDILQPTSVAVILDTRDSSLEILDWICEGFSENIEVINYGILPSGSMPVLLENFGHNLGIIISASHNPSEYNGIKLIDENGSKLQDEIEIKIEANIENILLPSAHTSYKESEEGYKVYFEFLNQILDFELTSFNLLIDSANGSAYKIIDELLKDSDAKYKMIANEPNGENINLASGATHTENLIKNLKKGEIGAAFDGDADRLIMVDENGITCNGDILILLIAKYLSSTNQLNNDVVVSTVMSNFGFKNAMEKNNFKNIETAVGDKYVAEAMLESNASIGGEQSGHIIISDKLPVGDGLLTLIYSLKALSFFKTTLSQFREDNIKEYPQQLINIELKNMPDINQLEELDNIAKTLSEEENLDGRYLIRNSGTEPLLRVLVEASEEESVEKFSENLVNKIKNFLQT